MTDTAPPICFVDTETTGLDAFRHQVYEVALITPELVERYDENAPEDDPIGFDVEWEEHHWWLNVDLSVADPQALRIGGYHDRHPLGHANHGALTTDKAKLVTDPGPFAAKFARLTHGLHLAGMVPSFDELFLRGVLLSGEQCPTWHHHLIDVETLAVGWLLNYSLEEGPDKAAELRELASPPWDSEAVSLAMGIDPAKFERHTAMGDARWAKAIYEAVQGG